MSKTQNPQPTTGRLQPVVRRAALIALGSVATAASILSEFAPKTREWKKLTKECDRLAASIRRMKLLGEISTADRTSV